VIRLSRTLLGALVAVCCTFVDAAPRAVRIGVTAGEESQIMSQVRDVAAKQGLRLDIVVFENPSHIDAALAGGSIDAASFEDEASLDARRRRDGYAIRSVAATVTLPMAFYSRKLASLAQLTRGATIAIPDDAPGMARALILLQNYAFVTLKDSAGLSPTVADITSNRYGLVIRHMPARPGNTCSRCVRAKRTRRGSRNSCAPITPATSPASSSRAIRIRCADHGEPVSTCVFVRMHGVRQVLQ
jgi:YaeC family lipoprotein